VEAFKSLLKRYSRACALFFVLLCGVWGIRGPLLHLPEHRGADIRSNDADSHYFVQAWDETPHFSDTLAWWHGPWGQKYRPFYRPIPSTLYWTQYQIFGVNARFQFELILLAWHLVAVIVAWRFLSELMGLRAGTLAAGTWAALFAEWFQLMTPEAALYRWKDNVESWHAIPYLLSLLCFLKFLRGGPKRLQSLSLLLFFVAICMKEMAYTLPLMLLLLLWHEEKWRSHWRAVLPFFALATLMFCFRYWAIGGMGFRMGTNEHWWARLLYDQFGSAFARMVRLDFLPLSVCCALLALWNLRQRKVAWSALFFIAMGLCWMVTARNAAMSVSEVVSRLLVEREWQEIPLLGVMLFFWWRCWVKREKHQLFGVGWAFISYLPLMSGPNTAHIYYFPSLGWAVWLTYALLDAGRLLRGVLPLKMVAPPPLERNFS
jgi:hypothetical protein